MSGRLTKTAFDFSLSIVLAALLFPIIILITLTVYLLLGWPVFFIQKRPGLNGKAFKMIKFRTLTNERDALGNYLPDEKRLTLFGRFLRSSSLDELPEIFNVLIGDMSFVGPRPLRLYYMPLYNEFQIQRQNVKPGITGWAQVNGRNSLSWEEKFELDVWYVRNRTFLLDLKIIWRTVLKVIYRADVSPVGGHFTAPFCGTGEKKLPLEEVMELKKQIG